MKDFKKKYFEKAGDMCKYYFYNDCYPIDAFIDLFPYINEMREALEIALENRNPHQIKQALKNLDDFVGGGE